MRRPDSAPRYGCAVNSDGAEPGALRLAAVIDRPRVLGEAAVDYMFIVGVDDHQHAQVGVFGSAKRAGEEDEALIGKGAHERGVIGDSRLRGDPSVGPGWAGLSDD